MVSVLSNHKCLCEVNDNLFVHYYIHSLHEKLFSWIFNCLRKADKNKDGKLSQSEVKNFLRLINIEVDDDYAEMVFEVKPSELFDGS